MPAGVVNPYPGLHRDQLPTIFMPGRPSGKREREREREREEREREREISLASSREEEYLAYTEVCIAPWGPKTQTGARL